MPTLRKYVNGDGYHIKGYLHGTGHVTWQIGDEGLRLLKDRGIQAHGDHLSNRDQADLLERGWIWVTGENPDRLPPGVLSLPADVRPLADEIGKWARRGSLDELQQILYGGRLGDQRDRCFSTGFLKWLVGIDPGLRLADLSSMSAPDFEDAADFVLDGLGDALHRFFAQRGQTHVLWQLARVVALVARQRQGSPTCPELWKVSSPVLHRLFVQLESVDPEAPHRQNAKLIYHSRRRVWKSPPRIVWEDGSQQIVALLPENVVSSELRGVTWSVTPGQVVSQPQTWASADGLRIEECRSQPLSPAITYLIETKLSGESLPRFHSYRLDLPDDFAPCVLFAVDGTMLGIAGDSPLSEGDYLALVRRESAHHLFQRRGVRQAERIDIAPVGWHGWQGWRLRLDGGADIAPYVVEVGTAPATWTMEPPPESSVQWRETLPVYLGCWPRLVLTSAKAFTGANLQVDRETAIGPKVFLPINARGGVPISTVGDQSELDLGAVAALQHVYGNVCLTCTPPSQPSAPALTARFIRLPQMRLTYTSDPKQFDQALAVRVQGSTEVLAPIDPGDDTELISEDDGIVLRAKMPHESPGVSARLAPHDAMLRVRIPSTRLGLVTEANGFMGWCQPPLVDLDLSTVEVRDRLRIELHETPVLEQGRLVCRLVGGDEVAAGWAIGGNGPIWQFEIELHRWRDTFGLTAGGVIQVRTLHRWLDVVRLRERDVPAVQVSQPEPVGKRAQLLAALEEALTNEDRAEVRKVAVKCHEHLSETGEQPLDRELLLLALARAFAAGAPVDLHESERLLAELGQRTDLPEAEILRRTVNLRLTAHGGNVWRLLFDQVNELTSDLVDIPQALLFRAECWYQFARHTQDPTEGGWRSCLELANQCLTRAGTRPAERRTAQVLHALARLMLALQPDTLPAKSQTGTVTDAWLTGLRVAAQSIRTPRYRITSKDVPDLDHNEVSVLCPEDAALIRVAVSLAQGRPARDSDFAVFAGWTNRQFFAINLLRARQSRLKKNESEARACYNRVLDEALLDRRLDFLIDVEASERMG